MPVWGGAYLPAGTPRPIVDRLNTEIHTPKDIREPLPILLLRTPYGAERGATNGFPVYLKELAEEGYLFVFQDIRGRYKSEGKFVMMRAPRDRADPKSIDEGTDAYDTLAWAVANVPLLWPAHSVAFEPVNAAFSPLRFMTANCRPCFDQFSGSGSGSCSQICLTIAAGAMPRPSSSSAFGP